MIGFATGATWTGITDTPHAMDATIQEEIHHVWDELADLEPVSPLRPSRV